MVVVRLRGGLGNQMFQYAAALAVARRHGVRIVLDLDRFRRDPDHEGFVLGRAFGIRARRLGPGLRLWRDRWVRRSPHSVLHVRDEGEGIEARSELLRAAPRWCYLDGYWVGEPCFAPVADEVRTLYAFSAPNDPDVTGIRARIAATESVAVHVRRGDFLTTPAFRRRVLTSEQLAAAAGRLRDAVGPANFFVFSDDPAWCARELRLPGPTEIVSTVRPRSSWVELGLLASCRHHVLTRSTFGWWGAWLAQHPDQVVVIPGGTSSPSVEPDRSDPAHWQVCD